MTQATLPTTSTGTPAISTSLPSMKFKSRDTRMLKDKVFVGICLVAATLSVVALVTLLTSILSRALGLTFEGWFPSLLLGLAVFGVGAGGIGSIILGVKSLSGKGGDRPIGKFAVAFVGFLVSVAILAYLWQIRTGKVWLTWSFLTGVPSRFAEEAGIWPATIGTVMICLVCAVTAIPIGIATAILLEEYKPKSSGLKRLHAFVQLNITNLAGVPSIVYGILGLTVFVQMFNIVGTTLAPGFEFGAIRFDRFYTEGGQVVQVPVADRTAPPTDPTKVATFTDMAGNPVQLELIPRAQFAERGNVVEDRIEAFREKVEAELEAAGAKDAAAIGVIVDAAWRETGMKSELAAVRETIVNGLASAMTLERREARAARRQAFGAAEGGEKQAEFPNILLAEAVPQRATETAPWYFRLPFGRGVLAGGLTLMLVVLPIIIISTQEALRAVPRSMRYASLALGATPWQTVWKITLPTAIPGIMTGTILAMSRAIGEAAPILIIAGIVYITYLPGDLMDDFTAMPLQIFNWASRPQAEFYNIAAAGIIILMAILLSFNALAVFIRQRTQKQY